MLVTVISVAMVMLTGHLLYGLPMDGKIRNSRALSEEELCDAGYFKSGSSCLKCDPGFFTSQKNREDRCHRCFQNCIPGDNSVGVLILCGFISVMLSVIILTLFLRLCRKKEKECFKHFVRKCSLGNMEVDSETTPPTSQLDEQPHAQEMLSHGSTPTNHNTDCSFHQPISSVQAVPPAGNLGPLHIYGPQTVFVSLLNQFGWDGGEKKAHELQEESLNNINVSCPQSPPVHLSEEERSRENDFIFFPSQEQGKECHISKEEVL
ncbi:hypothetical protein cypCar_00041829 [Cyprinus carpio]|nr:hypothetical protein cypCar_00041829 [Cyprinus carpio]